MVTLADRTYPKAPLPKSNSFFVALSGVILEVPAGVVNVTGLLIAADKFTEPLI
ncbi:hypothetical protein D3C84_1288570 [compost metagenome]